jgi:DNA repair exonuclease SbcCD nuclease subunit
VIYITGDCHKNFERFNTRAFPEQKEMTKDDYVIICGDFGGVWNKGVESKEETMLMDWLDCKSFTTLFVEGNHENFDRLYDYPVEEWHGGKVHKIRPSVIHLMRGEVFNIEGKKFFAFGGASSHDIKDGILDPVEDAEKIRKWNHDYTKMFRINHVSWWKEELPNKEEMQNGWDNLSDSNYKVDYIITHSPCASTIALLGMGLYKQDILTKYLEEIRVKTEYDKWFFGHLHDNRLINDKEILLYEQIIRIH